MGYDSWFIWMLKIFSVNQRDAFSLVRKLLEWGGQMSITHGTTRLVVAWVDERLLRFSTINTGCWGLLPIHSFFPLPWDAPNLVAYSCEAASSWRSSSGTASDTPHLPRGIAWAQSRASIESFHRDLSIRGRRWAFCKRLVGCIIRMTDILSAPPHYCHCPCASSTLWAAPLDLNHICTSDNSRT